MNQIIPLLGFSALVTISHGSALLFAKSQQKYSHKKREKLWRIHSLVNGSLWIVLLIWILLFQWLALHSIYPSWMRIIGLIMLIAGLYLSIKSRILLGRHQAMGIRFFLPEKTTKITSSLYSFLNNPMYDGFILIFIGVGLLFGIRENFYLAGASFILLNLLLARVENYKWSWNPF